jgi:hypothetical protein
LRDADLQRRDGGSVEVAQLERGVDRPDRVVAVGDGRAERRVDVAALVADGDLQDERVVAQQYRLRGPHQGVEVLGRPWVAVVVDAVEPQEQRHRRAQFGEELAHAGAEAIGDRRDHPLSTSVVVDGIVADRGPRVARDDAVEFGHDTEAFVGHVRAVAPLGDRECRPDGLGGRLVDHHLARGRFVFGRRQPTHGVAGEGVDQLDRRVADDGAHRRSGGDRDLHGQRHLVVADGDRAQAGHRVLQRERAPDGTARCRLGGTGSGSLVVGAQRVVVEPTRDRVAAVHDHAATSVGDLGDERVVDAVEHDEQLFGTALGSVGAHERLGERGEPGDVGEQRRAGAAARQLDTARERESTVFGDVREGGLGHVGEQCRTRERPPCHASRRGRTWFTAGARG